jgi:hypothetical protein
MYVRFKMQVIYNCKENHRDELGTMGVCFVHRIIVNIEYIRYFDRSYLGENSFTLWWKSFFVTLILILNQKYFFQNFCYVQNS